MRIEEMLRAEDKLGKYPRSTRTAENKSQNDTKKSGGKDKRNKVITPRRKRIKLLEGWCMKKMIGEKVQKKRVETSTFEEEEHEVKEDLDEKEL